MPDPIDAPELNGAFVTVDANPAPAGLETGHLDVPGGGRLRFVIGRGPAEMTSRGTVLLLQGRNEAVEKYYETIADLNRLGFTVASFDWRGQGGSGRLTPLAGVGHARSMRQLVWDLDRFLREVVMDRCPPPYAVLGHSMGGLVALAASDRLSPHVERMVLTAPLIGLPGTAGLHRLQRLVAGLFHWCGLGFVPLRRAARVGPGSTLAGNALTSDGARFERNRALQAAAPHLFVDALSASWVRAMLGTMRRLDDSDRIARLDLPTLFLLAGDDRVVSTPAAERLAWRMRSGHSIRVPGARHELLQEADRFREPVLAAIEAFLAGALPEPPPLPPIDEALLAATVVREAAEAETPDGAPVSR